MLIETFEADGNSLIVYSRNILSNDDNFRMIFKNDPGKISRKLFLYDICGLINNKIHKNLIVYRLLTNHEDLLLNKSQMGCFINTADGVELVYPDPLYAIRELENISSERYLANLKFRIQQVGFTSNNVSDNITFNEVFHFDLDSTQAQAQNDTVFVEALLKEDKKYKTLNEYPLGDLISEVKETDKDETSFAFIKKTKQVSFKSLREKPEGNDNLAKSAIGIFDSSVSLEEYLKPKKKKTTVLKFISG